MDGTSRQTLQRSEYLKHSTQQVAMTAFTPADSYMLGKRFHSAVAAVAS